MKKAIILMFVFILSTAASAQSFRNYKLSLGGGLQYKPLSRLEKSEFRNSIKESTKATLFAETQFSQNFSITAFYSFQSMRYTVACAPEIPGIIQEDYSFDFNPTYISPAKSKFQTLEIQARIYSWRNGYMAPWGRFISYGFIIGNSQTKLEKTSFTANAEGGGTVTVTLPNNKFSVGPIYGLSWGYGKKHYMNKLKNTFIETSFTYKLLFPTLYGLRRSETDIYDNATVTSLKKYQNSSIFNFAFIYGFSL